MVYNLQIADPGSAIRKKVSRIQESKNTWLRIRISNTELFNDLQLLASLCNGAIFINSLK